MRYIYLDEAGISKQAHEPIVVVAGPIINADYQWKDIERYLNQMADDFVHPEQRRGFVFHATELYSGGKHFPRETWPKEKRWKILDELASIGAPDKFHLPFVDGHVDRAKLAAQHPELSARQVTIRAQVIAFLMCVYSAQLYMQKAAPGEVATIVMENNNESRSLIKSMYQFVKDPANASILQAKAFGSFIPENIVDDVHFTEKQRSSPLQIADAAAFCIKRHLMNAPDCERFYAPFKSQLVMLPKADLAPLLE